MASRSADFNYKVALASGLKSLQGGRLRQAEEQFRYLVQRFPSAEGGYRGLAKVLVEQEDRSGALRILLEGGAALAKAGQRSSAVALYREATTLDPTDLASHRRLAAALALSGDRDEAAREYVRFIQPLLTADPARAKLELAYALERLPGDRALLALANGSGGPHAEHAPVDGPLPTATADERQALMREVLGSAAPSAPAAPVWELPAQAWDTAHRSSETAQISETAADAAEPARSWETAASAEPAAPTSWDHPASWGQPVADGGAAPADPVVADVDPVAVEAAAARSLASRDPRAGEQALAAARRHIADGRVDAASDLLLQLIAAGIADHDAQRLLVEVTKSLGKNDVAKAKVQLLVEALKLDGRAELAAEVEQLAQAF